MIITTGYTDRDREETDDAILSLVFRRQAKESLKLAAKARTLATFEGVAWDALTAPEQAAYRQRVLK